MPGSGGRRRHVLVTGGAGFLGSHVCAAYLDQGAAVTCVDTFTTSSRANLADLSGRAGFRLVRHDITEPMEVDAPIDVIVHLASPASPADYLRMPIETMMIGALGTKHALDLARQHAARLVVASTSEVYGDPLRHPQRENYWGNVNPVGPRGVYDEAKRFGEALTTAYRDRYGVDTGIVRLFNSYGPLMRRDDGRAVPTFVSQALAGEPLTVTGDGSQTRSLCFVDDTVRGIVAMGEVRHPGPVNIGSPDEITVLDLARTVLAVTRVDLPIRFIDLPVDDPRVRRPDTSLARAILGWEPEVPLQEGLARTVDWFASTGTASVTGMPSSPAAAITTSEA